MKIVIFTIIKDSLRKTAELAIYDIVTIIFSRRLNEKSNESSTTGELIFEFICDMCDIYSTSSAVPDTSSQPSMKLGSSTNTMSTTVNSIGTRYLGINLACHVIELLGDRLTLSSYQNILRMVCNQLCRALLRNVNISYQTILFLANGEMMFSGSTQSGLGSNSTITSSVLATANGGNLQPTHSNYGNNLMLLSAALKCSITYLFSLANIRIFLHEQISAILLSLLQHLSPSQQQYGSSSKKSQFSNSPILGNTSLFLPFELQELILEYLVEVCRDSNFIAFLYRHYDCYGCFDKKNQVNVNSIPNLFEHIYLYLNSYIGLNSSVSGTMLGNPSIQNNIIGNTIQIGQSGSSNFNNFTSNSSSSTSLSSSSLGSSNLHTLHVLAWQGLLSVVRCLAERCQEQQEQNVRQSLDMNVVNNMTSEIKLHKKQKHRMMEIVSLFNSSPLEGVTQLLQIYNITIPKDLTSFIRNENSVDENSITVDWNEAVSLLQRASEKISNFLLEYNVWLDKQKIVDYFNSFSSPANTIVDIKIKESAFTETNRTLTENTYLIPILSKSKKDPLRNVLPLEVMRQFMDGFDFYGMRIDEAMRYFINRCKISGEGQQVERIVKLLGECYYRDNNTNFAKERHISCNARIVPAVPYLANGEQAWILAVAIMMLHTDLHHHHNRNNRMNLEGFIRTVGYHEELQDMPKEELQKIFHYVLTNEFEVVTGLIDSYKSETVWNELIIRGSMEYYERNFNQKSSSISNENDNLLPFIYDMEMFQSMWGHVILATTIILENSDDIHLLELAIRGFLDSARVAATYHLHHVFDNLVITLCKFTTLLDGVTPPSISVVNCSNNSSQQTLDSTGLTWPTNTSISTTIVSHDGVVISTINGGVDGVVTSPASPSANNQIINSSSSSFNSNIGSKVASSSRTDKNRSIVMFGHNEKAKLACRTVFAITRKYGDNLREGWKNILDLICRMRELELLPESLVESRLVRQLREFQFSSSHESKISSPRKESGSDQSLSNQASSQLLTSGSSLYGHIISSISKSATKKLKPKSQNQTQTQVKSATFSLLSSVFGGFYGSSSSEESNVKKKNNWDDSDDSDDDSESQALGGQDTEFEHFSIEIKHALDEARKCIEQCRIVELLMMDAKELSGHSLEYLLSALIRNGKPSGVLMSMHIPAPHLFALKTSTTPQKQSPTSNSTVTYYYYERDIETSLFCLDLLCDVLISNNLNRNTITDRLKLIWNYAYGHVYKLMISILQIYEPINVIQSIYQVSSSAQSAPSSLGSSSKVSGSTNSLPSERASPISTSTTTLRTRMTKQHYHILQRCITCIWRLCMELSTPSTSLNQVTDKSSSEQQEWSFIQKEMLSVLIDHLGKQWNEGLLGVFHMSLLPMIHMFLSRHGENLLSPMGKKFIHERTNMTNNTSGNTLVLSSISQVIVEFWDHLVFKMLKSISTASTSWINNNPSSTLFTSLKPSQQLQLISRSLDVLTLSLQQNTTHSQDSSNFNIWFVVPDNIPTFVQTLISILSASITTNVNVQSSNSNHTQFIGTLKKLMTLAQDILSILENLVPEILKRIVSTAFSSVNGSQNVIRLDNKWINAWLSILEGISVFCCTGGINNSSSSGNALHLLMSQLNNNQIQMLSQLQRDIRTQALSALQRSLIVSCDFKYASSLNQQLMNDSPNENLKYLLNDQLLMLCMEKVLIKSFLQTLLGLKPKTTEYQSNHNTEMDISSLEELRVRANNLLARIFLHFLPRMFTISENQQESGFHSLWLLILQIMYSFLLVKPKSDHLREALPELLKNMILVMNNIEVFKLNPQLWTLTENELSQTMPSLVEDVKPRIIASMNSNQSDNNLSNESETNASPAATSSVLPTPNEQEVTQPRQQ